MLMILIHVTSRLMQPRKWLKQRICPAVKIMLHYPLNNDCLIQNLLIVLTQLSSWKQHCLQTHLYIYIYIYRKCPIRLEATAIQVGKAAPSFVKKKKKILYYKILTQTFNWMSGI